MADNSTHVGLDPDYKNAEFALYRYAPSMACCVVFTILFFLTTLLHMIQMFKSRTWYLVPFVLGGICKFPQISIPPYPPLLFIHFYHGSPSDQS
jgi:hypothetical protein